MFSGPDIGSFRRRLLFAVLGMASLLAFSPVMTALAGEDAGIQATSSEAASEFFAFTEYGQVVYQKNSHLPQQIYIIGQMHRSPLTDRGGPDIVRVQAEIYRIGEWLIREKQVEMLLPEGFFEQAAGENIPWKESAGEGGHLDNRSLEARLADPRRFVNADLLLNASYHIPLGQVENERLYRDALRLLREASREGSLAAFSRLDGLQDERTAFMLQNIPDIMETAYQSGRIANRKAMFTIGLAHVRGIIDFLNKGSLRAAAGQNRQGEAEEGLKLFDQGYGVTVIIPRALAENEQLLRLARFVPD